ncbi:hypothetical protein [Nostoc sp. JL31]|nr:hypothetical protein [Nostoc sp. JL31]
MVVLTDFKALSIKDYSHHCLALFLLPSRLTAAIAIRHINI